MMPLEIACLVLLGGVFAAILFVAGFVCGVAVDEHGRRVLRGWK